MQWITEKEAEDQNIALPTVQYKGQSYTRFEFEDLQFKEWLSIYDPEVKQAINEIDELYEYRPTGDFVYCGDGDGQNVVRAYAHMIRKPTK